MIRQSGERQSAEMFGKLHPQRIGCGASLSSRDHPIDLAICHNAMLSPPVPIRAIRNTGLLEV
jgi:hypothetical protein